MNRETNRIILAWGAHQPPRLPFATPKGCRATNRDGGACGGTAVRGETCQHHHPARPARDITALGATWTHIYFIQAVEGPHPRPIKIGKAHDVAQRLRDHQCSSPWRLEVLRTVKAPAQIEGHLHFDFAHLRVRGEWFRPEPDLLEAIDGWPDEQFLGEYATETREPDYGEFVDHAAWLGYARAA